MLTNKRKGEQRVNETRLQNVPPQGAHRGERSPLRLVRGSFTFRLPRVIWQACAGFRHFTELFSQSPVASGWERPRSQRVVSDIQAQLNLCQYAGDEIHSSILPQGSRVSDKSSERPQQVLLLALCCNDLQLPGITQERR
ncbi:hypothetical protein P7K49_008904 [Saguinus oedipus]|uniref:Uncharacterized protein n=1 Tax=Saguinus oedipus TaxID=9490 RepID=A0ABQ9W1G7_SAGOE|nr:hypothetical protein P7K49_008904 [Saguinus oedipus]